MKKDKSQGDPKLKNIFIPKEWKALTRRLKKSPIPTIIMVIGTIDTGKSTLSHFLFKEFCMMSTLTALVDADLGQSVIGPPTTVGLSIKKGSKSIRSSTSFCFVGSTSPRGHMIQAIVAVKKLVWIMSQEYGPFYMRMARSKTSVIHQDSQEFTIGKGITRRGSGS